MYRLYCYQTYHIFWSQNFIENMQTYNVQITKVQLTAKQKSTAISSRRNTTVNSPEFGQYGLLLKRASVEKCWCRLNTKTEKFNAKQCISDTITKIKAASRFFDVKNRSFRYLLPNKNKAYMPVLIRFCITHYSEPINKIWWDLWVLRFYTDPKMNWCAIFHW